LPKARIAMLPSRADATVRPAGGLTLGHLPNISKLTSWA
jgi:hypothetical protein